MALRSCGASDHADRFGCCSAPECINQFVGHNTLVVSGDRTEPVTGFGFRDEPMMARQGQSNEIGCSLPRGDRRPPSQRLNGKQHVFVDIERGSHYEHLKDCCLDAIASNIIPQT